MSSIGPGIAGSVSQSAVQQSQIARQVDAAKNRDQQLARKIREQIEKHLHEVEDPDETDGSGERVAEHQQEQEGGRRRRENQDHAELSAAAHDADQAPAEADGSDADQGPADASGDGRDKPADPPRRLDIRA
jgi:predicted DNA-binding protein